MTAAHAQDPVAGPEAAVADLQVQPAKQPRQAMTPELLCLGNRVLGRRGQGRQADHAAGGPCGQVLGRPAPVTPPEPAAPLRQPDLDERRRGSSSRYSPAATSACTAANTSSSVMAQPSHSMLTAEHDAAHPAAAEHAAPATDRPAWRRNAYGRCQAPRTRAIPCQAALMTPPSPSQARLASSLPFRLAHSCSAGFSSGAYPGSRSTTSQSRCEATNAAIAVLRWAGSPSHSTVAFWPPRNTRSCLRASIRLTVS